jgi:hypothetical protein
MTLGASITKAAHTVNRVALGLARQWWRPLGAASVVGSLIVNGMVVPLLHHQPLDLSGFALVITAFAGLYGVRSYEKVKGVA